MCEDIEHVELWGWIYYFSNISESQTQDIVNMLLIDRELACKASTHLLVDHMDNASHQLHIIWYKGCAKEVLTYLQQIANE